MTPDPPSFRGVFFGQFPCLITINCSCFASRSCFTLLFLFSYKPVIIRRRTGLPDCPRSKLEGGFESAGHTWPTVSDTGTTKKWTNSNTAHSGTELGFIYLGQTPVKLYCRRHYWNYTHADRLEEAGFQTAFKRRFDCITQSVIRQRLTALMTCGWWRNCPNQLKRSYGTLLTGQSSPVSVFWSRQSPAFGTIDRPPGWVSHWPVERGLQCFPRLKKTHHETTETSVVVFKSVLNCWEKLFDTE